MEDVATGYISLCIGIYAKFIGLWVAKTCNHLFVLMQVIVLTFTICCQPVFSEMEVTEQ